MKRKVYNDPYPVVVSELPEQRLAYHDEVELVRYTDTYQSRIELLKIKYVVIAILLLIATVLGIWTIGKVDKYFMAQKVHNISETEVCLLTSAESYIGQNYLLVIEEVKATGLYDIETMPKRDLITGWITHPGTVSRITIAGNPEFKAGDIYQKDVKVIIEYHAL